MQETDNNSNITGFKLPSHDPLIFVHSVFIVIIILFLTMSVIKPEETFAQGQEINSNNNDTLYDKGNALYDLGRYQEAIEYYDKVLAINPNDVDALNNKANALANLGESIQPALYYKEQLLVQTNYVYLNNAEIENISVVEEKSANNWKWSNVNRES